jgi:hypothetical protein
MIARIQQRTALFRQVQAAFHEHLLGIYSWEQVAFRKAEKVEREKKANGTPLPFEAGKFHDKIDMYFGPFDLVVLGPFEDEKHPMGLIKISMGSRSCDGPIDATTWQRVAAFIKENRTEESDDGRTAGTHWGR